MNYLVPLENQIFLFLATKIEEIREQPRVLLFFQENPTATLKFPLQQRITAQQTRLVNVTLTATAGTHTYGEVIYDGVFEIIVDDYISTAIQDYAIDANNRNAVAAAMLFPDSGEYTEVGATSASEYVIESVTTVENTHTMVNPLDPAIKGWVGYRIPETIFGDIMITAIKKRYSRQDVVRTYIDGVETNVTVSQFDAPTPLEVWPNSYYRNEPVRQWTQGSIYGNYDTENWYEGRLVVDNLAEYYCGYTIIETTDVFEPSQTDPNMTEQKHGSHLYGHWRIEGNHDFSVSPFVKIGEFGLNAEVHSYIITKSTQMYFSRISWGTFGTPTPMPARGGGILPVTIAGLLQEFIHGVNGKPTKDLSQVPLVGLPFPIDVIRKIINARLTIGV